MNITIIESRLKKDLGEGKAIYTATFAPVEVEGATVSQADTFEAKLQPGQVLDAVLTYNQQYRTWNLKAVKARGGSTRGMTPQEIRNASLGHAIALWGAIEPAPAWADQASENPSEIVIRVAKRFAKYISEG